MSRTEKLIRKLRSGSALSFGELQAILELFGFRLDRTGGSHHIYVHPQVSRPVSIQPDGKDAKRYQVRQVRDIIDEFELEPIRDE